VLDRPESGDLDEKSMVNLNLLKGLLNEIQIETYVEDIMMKLKRVDSSYKNLDIYDWKGFDDFSPVNDHPNIQKVVKQIALIDPYQLLTAFGNVS
jgi:hypothetical protein